MDHFASEVAKAAFDRDLPLRPAEAEADDVMWHTIVDLDNGGCRKCGRRDSLFGVGSPVRGGQLKCGKCGYKAGNYTHTIFKNSKMQRSQIVSACVILSIRPTIPSTELARIIRATQKSAYYLKRKILSVETIG